MDPSAKVRDVESVHDTHSLASDDEHEHEHDHDASVGSGDMHRRHIALDSSRVIEYEDSTPLLCGACVTPRLLLWCTIVLPVATCIATYAVYLSGAHHPAGEWMPFISDTGDYAPESCVFTLGLGATASLLVVTAYTLGKLFQLRLREVHAGESARVAHARRLNRAATWFGIITGVSLHGVASFQFHVLHGYPHLAFALVLFVSLAVYVWLLAVLSVLMRSSPRAIAVRFVVAVLALAAVTMLFAMLAVRLYNEAAVAEVSVVALGMAQLATLTPELSRTRIVLSARSSAEHGLLVLQA